MHSPIWTRHIHSFSDRNEDAGYYGDKPASSSLTMVVRHPLVFLSFSEESRNIYSANTTWQTRPTAVAGYFKRRLEDNGVFQADFALTRTRRLLLWKRWQDGGRMEGRVGRGSSDGLFVGGIENSWQDNFHRENYHCVESLTFFMADVKQSMCVMETIFFLLFRQRYKYRTDNVLSVW